MKRKILFISHWYPSEKSPFLGIFIKRHAEAISKFEDIEVIHFDIQYSKKLIELNLRKESGKDFITYKIEVYSLFYKLFYYLIPLHLILLNKLIKKFKINLSDFKIVHSNVLFPNGIIGYLISRKYKIPQVHSEHWSRINHFLKSDILKRYGKKAMENSEYILPVSNLLKLKIEESLQNLKYEIIPNIIDSKLFTYNPKTKNNITRFLAVGNWQKPKNPFYFLNALCILYNSEKLRNFELTIVGEGKFISKIKSTKYPFTINFIGKVNPDKTVDYFQKSDFLLHGSDFETFSVVIIESLLTGTPVIASNIGIASEVINETNGFICEEENDWVRNIELAVKKEYNHKEISEQLKGKFDEEVIGLRIKSIYDRILNYYL